MNSSARRAGAPRLLITMPWGIGDTIAIGLSAVDQVRRNDSQGGAIIDILCNPMQAPIFAHDPRIHKLIVADKNLFPTAAPGTWKRGLFLPSKAAALARQLHRCGYTAVLPFLFSPGFFYLLHAPVLFLNMQETWDVMTALRTFGDVPIQSVVRRAINKGFADKTKPRVDEPIPLYLSPEHLQRARQDAARVMRQAGGQPDSSPWMLVAPDTSSHVTRPPTGLLADALAGALRIRSDLFAMILPGYTDMQAARNLWRALAPSFPDRVTLLPAEPRMALLELAAFIDQSDIFLTGDTSTMHLAATRKMLPYAAHSDLLPRNTVKIIALFGGTHPGFHGYSRRTTIIGRGRMEQTAFAPGIAKEIYHPDGRDFFDHISSGQITEAILHQRSFAHE